MSIEIKNELHSIFGMNDSIVIADIGACDGESSVEYAKMFPKSFIHAFEPRQDNCHLMTKNFIDANIFDRCSIHMCALGDKENKLVSFYSSHGQAPGIEHDTGNKSSSLLRPKAHLTEHGWCKFEEEKVIMHRLDDMHIPDHFDYVHMDVQGAEMMVLKGGARSFKHVRVFWIEVANIELYRGQPLRSDILRYMDGKKYRVMKDTCGNKKYGDILFVRK